MPSWQNKIPVLEKMNGKQEKGHKHRNQDQNPIPEKRKKKEEQRTALGSACGVNGTGASRSAGGQDAKQEMVVSLATSRKDLKLTVVQRGQWDDALFGVDLQVEA